MYRKDVELEPPREPRTSVLPSPLWRTLSFITWVGALAALIAVAVSSRTIGRPVWWLGTQFDPAPPVYMLVPLALVVVPAIAAWRAPHIMIATSLTCSVLIMMSATIDRTSSPSVALAVLVIGLASFLSSIAQLLATRNYG